MTMHFSKFERSFLNALLFTFVLLLLLNGFMRFKYEAHISIVIPSEAEGSGLKNKIPRLPKFTPSTVEGVARNDEEAA